MNKKKTGEQKESNSPLARLREAAELSQEELAGLIDVSVSTVSRWERGLAEPTMTVYQMKDFCKAVNKTLEELPDSLLPPHAQKVR
ncbi:MAG: helix-turn-helix transcriptional regulator [Potamolinea sp.]